MTAKAATLRAAVERAVPRVSEARFHRIVKTFLDVALPVDAYYTTIGHGGGGRIRGAQLKAAGVKPGVPDILIVYRNAAIFIELKGPNGIVSPEQKRCHAALQAAGARVAVCRSLADVETFLKYHIGIPLVSRVAA